MGRSIGMDSGDGGRQRHRAGLSHTLRRMIRAARVNRIASVAAGCFALGALAFAGCSSRRTDAVGVQPTKPSPATDGVVAAAPAPVATGPLAAHTASAINISDLSRVERDLRRRPLIELRIDATDAAGAPARIGGAIRVVVDAPGAAPASQTFDLSLRTQAEADERYDPILRQYVLRIEPVWATEPARGSAVEIRATLSLASGATTEATGTIEW
jgi:hypothetical protein